MKIAVIRIKGLVNVDVEIKETLDKLRLRKKHVCVIVDNKKEILGMLKKAQDYIAYGEITKEQFKKLIEKRAEPKKKITDEEINSFFEGKKKIQDLGIKPFFRLHPPRGGFKKSTKSLWPRGVLGNQGKEINKLIIKML